MYLVLSPLGIHSSQHLLLFILILLPSLLFLLLILLTALWESVILGDQNELSLCPEEFCILLGPWCRHAVAGILCFLQTQHVKLQVSVVLLQGERQYMLRDRRDEVASRSCVHVKLQCSMWQCTVEDSDVYHLRR